MVICVLQGICPVHLSSRMYWHKVVRNVPLLSGESIVIPLLFLMLEICIFALFSLVSLTRGLSLLLIFPKNKLLFSLILSTVFLYCFIYFHFDLYYSFLQLFWVSFALLFLSLRWESRSMISNFSFFNIAI